MREAATHTRPMLATGDGNAEAGASGWFVPVLSVLAFVLVWQTAAWWAGEPHQLPSPASVLAKLVAAARTGDLFWHLGITLLRVAASFAIAMTLGTALGIAMGQNRALDRALQPWLILFLNMPALVVIVLAYIWIGLAESAAILAVAVNKIPNVVVTVREGTRALDRDLGAMAQVFRFGRLRTLRHVVLPQLAPYLVASARSGLALIWKIVLVVELMGRSNGVGFVIGLSFQLFDVATILAYALAFVAVVQALEWGVLQPWERHVGLWRR
ncbi:ABC transporter permease [Marinivivus vitaminiproducens]|uniref:ABC transporter permease n=1 Tax=Marinivivus vitaminiproducens TaxID=3035935 RepID=UPI00279B5F96|nr:ABC transporter permease [Geminicoccaceae bacterium SCSIO 64248]